MSTKNILVDEMYDSLDKQIEKVIGSSCTLSQLRELDGSITEWREEYMDILRSIYCNLCNFTKIESEYVDGKLQLPIVLSASENCTEEPSRKRKKQFLLNKNISNNINMNIKHCFSVSWVKELLFLRIEQPFYIFKDVPTIRRYVPPEIVYTSICGHNQEDVKNNNIYRTDLLVERRKYNKNNMNYSNTIVEISPILSARLIKLYLIAALGCFHFEQYRIFGTTNYVGKKDIWLKYEQYLKKNEDSSVIQFHIINQLLTTKPDGKINDLLKDVQLNQVIDYIQSPNENKRLRLQGDFIDNNYVNLLTNQSRLVYDEVVVVSEDEESEEEEE